MRWKRPAPAHIGLVDGLEAFHGGAIERHAVGEGVLQEFACRHGEVLLNTDQIGEANGDILDASLLIRASASALVSSAVTGPLLSNK